MSAYNMPGGRPATYSPELADAICEALALDTRGLDAICDENETFPSGRTVRSWLLKVPEFLPKYAGAREAQMELMASEIIELSDDKSDDVTGELEMPNSVAVARSRLQVDTRKWLMSKLAPKKYGDKVQTEVSGAGGGPIQAAIAVTFVKTNESSKS